MTCCQSLHRARVFQLFDARTAGHRPLTTGADGAFHNAILRWIVSRASGVDSAQARIVRISSTLSRDTIEKREDQVFAHHNIILTSTTLESNMSQKNRPSRMAENRFF